MKQIEEKIDKPAVKEQRNQAVVAAAQTKLEAIPENNTKNSNNLNNNQNGGQDGQGLKIKNKKEFLLNGQLNLNSKSPYLTAETFQKPASIQNNAKYSFKFENAPVAKTQNINKGVIAKQANNIIRSGGF